jgi:serine/threonine protein kinase
MNDLAKAPQILGNYEIVAPIAEGGMGVVYKGRRRSDGLLVAIKVVPPTAAKNPVLLQRFQREFQAASAIDHPNVVRAIEYNGTPPTPFLVMEFVDGMSLGQKIEREGRLSEDEAIRIMAQVCQGLHRAHKQGLIHRDIKPDNILLARDGTAKITDLGLVKDIEGELNLTRTGRGLGTPHFMAPEQFRNAKNADIRCDVYSLGATLYMMLTGKMPFEGLGPLDAWMKKSNNDFTPPRELNTGISTRMNFAILRAMHSDPDKRPSNCREFIEDVTGQSTRISTTAIPAQNNAPELWYMVYRDDEGQTHTVKGTTENIRKAFSDGLLGDAGNIRVCRSKQGPFLPLRDHAEFRDLVWNTAPADPAGPPSTTTGPAPGLNPTPSHTRNPTPLVGSGSGKRGPNDSTVAYPPVPLSSKISNYSPPEDAVETAAPNNQSAVVWILVGLVAFGLALAAFALLPRLFQ